MEGVDQRPLNEVIFIGEVKLSRSRVVDLFKKDLPWFRDGVQNTPKKKQSAFLSLHAKSLQFCLTLCDPMDCSLPGSSVHGILQARILEWVAISSSRGSSWPRDQTCVSCSSCSGRQVTTSATWEAPETDANMALVDAAFRFKDTQAFGGQCVGLDQGFSNFTAHKQHPRDF